MFWMKLYIYIWLNLTSIIYIYIIFNFSTDNRRLYLTRTLDVKLERCTIYVILDARWIEYEGIVIRSRVTRGILNYAVDTSRTSWNTTRKPSRVYIDEETRACARYHVLVQLLTRLSNLEQLVFSDRGGAGIARLALIPTTPRYRVVRAIHAILEINEADPNSSILQLS